MRIDACLRAGIAGLLIGLGFAPIANATCQSDWVPPPEAPYPRNGPPWSAPWFETGWILPEAPANLADGKPPASLSGLLRLWTSDFGRAEYWHRYTHALGPSPLSFARSQQASPPVQPACESQASPLLPGEHVYITFGVVAQVRENSGFPSINDDLHTGQLYVGGWPVEFDASLGGHPRAHVNPASGYDPRDAGFLRITGGSLKVHGCGCVNNPALPGAPPGSPPCLLNNVVECYERIGYRGTYGEVVQSGGYHEAANTISLGLGSRFDALCLDLDSEAEDPPTGVRASSCSHGVYELSGGTLKANGGVACGAQGKGEFVMTGGTYDGGGGFAVGNTYAYSGALDTSDPIAGRCTFTESGGDFDQQEIFSIGHGAFGANRATGVARISGDAWFRATSLWAGGGDSDEFTDPDADPENDHDLTPGGDGTIVQTGGEVNVTFFIALGASPGGNGAYTISGGSLSQTLSSGPVYQRWLGFEDPGLYVGLDYDEPYTEDGHGEFVVEGADSTIDVAGVYHQGSDSRLTFKIEELEPHITPIEVARTATFEPGAKLKLEALGDWTPGGNQHFVVFRAQSVVGESNLTLDSSSGEWSLSWTGTGPRTLVVTKIHPCGLLGIEPALLLLGLRMRRGRPRASGSAAQRP